MKLLSLLLACAFLTCPSNSQTVKLNDRSDWWSLNNEREPGMHMKVLGKRFDRNNFKILGLSLDTLSFEEAAAKLGPAKK